jgi:hypothetical protein
MKSGLRLPTGLLRGEPVNRGVDWHKPVGLIVGRLEFVEKQAAQGRRGWLVLRGRNGTEQESRNEGEDDMLHENCSLEVMWDGYLE